MKDATGELSMTAVTVVAIAAIGVVFSTLIWPNIRKNIMRNMYCSEAFDCTPASGDGSMMTCKYCKNSDGAGEDEATCEETGEIQCSANTGTGA